MGYGMPTSLAGTIAGRYGGSARDPYGSGSEDRVSELQQLLLELERSRRGQQGPRSFRDLPQDQRRDANRMGWMQLAAAISNAEPGRLGSALLQGAMAREGTRQQAVQAYQERAEREESSRRDELMERFRIAQLRREVDDDEGQRRHEAAARTSLPSPPAGSGIPQAAWDAFGSNQRLDATLQASAGQAKEAREREHLQLVAERVRNVVNARHGDGDAAFDAVLAGMTPSDVVRVFTPEKEADAKLTPYQQYEIGHQHERDRIDNEHYAEAQRLAVEGRAAAVEKERRQAEYQQQQAEAVRAFLRENGLKPSGDDDTDRSRAKKIEGALPEEGSKGNWFTRLFGDDEQAPAPPAPPYVRPRPRQADAPPPGIVAPGVGTKQGPRQADAPPPGIVAPGVGTKQAGDNATPFRGNGPKAETHPNANDNAAKAADNVLRAVLGQSAAGASRALRQQVAADLRAGKKPEDIVRELRAALGGMGGG